MAIKKQEFYEGAALHILARSGAISSLYYQAPLFFLNGSIRVLLKYSTRGRSPWSFTFMPYEQALLKETASAHRVIIGLVCGSDGIVALEYDMFSSIAVKRDSAIHIGCFRPHGKHYEVNGPDGTLARKVAPSDWQRIIIQRGKDET